MRPDRPARDTKEIAFAEAVPFALQLAVDLSQCMALAAEVTRGLEDGLPFGRGTIAIPGRAKELPEIGVLREVTDQSADGVGLEGKALSDLIGREPLEKVGTANLVVLRGRGLWRFKHHGEFLGTCHGSWGWLRQVAARNARRYGCLCHG